MPIDASIYQNLKPMQMPSYADAQQKAMNMRQLAMQNERAASLMDQEAREREMAERKRKLQTVGSAMDTLAGMRPEERAMAYPKMREQLLAEGAISPEESPEQYDEGLFRQQMYNLNQYRNSPEYLANQKTKAEIGKLNAEARKKDSAASDPLALFENRLALKDKYDEMKADREMKRYANVQGWGLAEGATPTKEDAKKFKDSVTASEGMKKSLARLQELTNQHGTEIWPGAVKGEMDQLSRDIQLQAKELYNLGVLNGPDLSLLNEVVTRPTAVSEWFNPSGNERARGGLRRFGEMMENRVNSQADVLGFAKNDAASGDTKTAQTGAGRGGVSDGLSEAHAGSDTPSVKMRAPDGSLRMVPRDQVDAALKAGGRLAR